MSKEPTPEPQRRSTHVAPGVVYAAVGASAAPDLMRFPPEGSLPYEYETQLGSGAERFLIASNSLMTWGAQRESGIRVRDITHGDGGQYAGVTFDENGTPQANGDAEIHYGPDGQPFITVGTEATLHWPDGRTPRRARVIATVNEPRRIGFTWGSADTEGVFGEQMFAIEHRDDDTVWASVRGFLWLPDDGLFSIKGKAAGKQLIKEAHAQLAALATGVVPTGD